VERQFHDSGLDRGVLTIGDLSGELHDRLQAERLERFIGVVYRPEMELQSHYANVELAGQFDAYVWFDTTSAVEPLPTAVQQGGPDTWPFGV